MHRFGQSSAVAIPLVFALTQVHANVTISSKPTQNMTCAAGVCAPTAGNAVLNAGDLETLLASGSVTVTTTGSNVQATSIRVKQSFGWSDTSVLVLDSYADIAIDRSVSVEGTGGLTLTTGDGGKRGAVTFGGQGKVSFANLSSQLVIDGTNYQLEGDIKTLANDIARKADGAFALAADYDARGDGVYANSPIEAPFGGAFTALGNVITNLVIIDQGEENVGLFAEVKSKGMIRDVRLTDVIVRASALNSNLGAVAGRSAGTIEDARVDGKIRGADSHAGSIAGENAGIVTASRSAGKVSADELAGGLVGENDATGKITKSSSSAAVSGRGDQFAGGLVGYNQGTIASNFATGSVAIGTRSGIAQCGGLVGEQEGSGAITNSYATASVTCFESYVGGFIGQNYSGTISTSYSTGRVRAGRNPAYMGGFVGVNPGGLTDCYWDTTTSGTDKGAGSGTNQGITGLTTKKLQSGLPSGFDPKIWTENAKINNGLPYLIGNPPSR